MEFVNFINTLTSLYSVSLPNGPIDSSEWPSPTLSRIPAGRDSNWRQAYVIIHGIKPTFYVIFHDINEMRITMKEL